MNRSDRMHGGVILYLHQSLVSRRVLDLDKFDFLRFCLVFGGAEKQAATFSWDLLQISKQHEDRDWYGRGDQGDGNNREERSREHCWEF